MQRTLLHAEGISCRRVPNVLVVPEVQQGFSHHPLQTLMQQAALLVHHCTIRMVRYLSHQWCS